MRARIYIHLQVIQLSHHLDLHFAIVGFVIMAVITWQMHVYTSIGWHVLSYTQYTGFIHFWPICLPTALITYIPFINYLPKKIRVKVVPEHHFTRHRESVVNIPISDSDDAYIFELCMTYCF